MITYTAGLLGLGMWNTVPPNAFKALSQFVDNPTRGGVTSDIGVLKKRNMVQEPIPWVEQPLERELEWEKEHGAEGIAHQAWDQALLSTQEQREAMKIESRSASWILAETQRLLLSGRPNPGEQTFTGVGNILRDEGAASFERDERKILEIMGGWYAEFEKEKAAAAPSEEPKTGLEEKPAVDLAGEIFVVFDPTAGLPLIQKLGADAYVVVTTPKDAEHQVNLGVEPERLIGVVTNRILSGNYQGLVPGMRNFEEVSDFSEGWQNRVVQLLALRFGKERKLILITNDKRALTIELETLGIPGNLMSEVFEAQTQAEADLALMQ